MAYSARFMAKNHRAIAVGLAMADLWRFVANMQLIGDVVFRESTKECNSRFINYSPL
jgi:hypothetical protein